MQRALPSPTPPTLEYAPPPPWHRRRGARRAMILATLVLAGLIAYRFAPMAWRQARLLYWQSKCMNYRAPADKVVFSAWPFNGWKSADWESYYATYSPPGQRSDATLFVGERTAPNGNRRLVAVNAVKSGEGRTTNDGYVLTGFLSGHARLFELGSAGTRPVEKHQIQFPESHAGFVFREGIVVYAGQPDPADTSHFTIRAEVDGTGQLIDGWLTNDDRVLLERRTTSPPPSTQPDQ
jgi:hypothetical protein